MGLFIQFAYVISAALFIYGLKQLGSPATARRGNMLSSLGMLLAIVAALLDQGIVEYQWILIGFVVGGLILRQAILVSGALPTLNIGGFEFRRVARPKEPKPAIGSMPPH